MIPSGWLRFLILILLGCLTLASGGNIIASSPTAVRADSLFSSAKAHFNSGRQADAMDDLFELLRIADTTENNAEVEAELQSKACLMLGNIYLGYNDHLNAAKFYRKGLDLSSDPEQHLKFAYNLTLAYCLIGDEAKAREYNTLIARTKSSNTPLLLYDLAMSEAMIEKAFGDRRRSITMFKHALNLVDSFGMAPANAIGPMSEVAEYYETSNHTDSARRWLQDYERVALASRYPNAVADSRRGLMRLFIKTGEREKALEYSSLYLASMDSLVDFQRFISISSRREREREDATEAHIENLEFIISKQQAAIYGIIIFLILAGGIWFVILKFRGNMRHLFARNRELAILEDKTHTSSESIPPDTESSSGKEWEPLMKKIDETLSDPANYLDPDFSINTLAELCGSNTRYISQAINESTGDNFRSLLNGYRIREARRRLTSDPCFADLTIQSIGESVGFRSASNFINAFRKVTGMTPSLYQKMTKEKEAL